MSCEHGGNRIPAAYRCYFAQHFALLQSHRGYDPGSLDLARDLAHACGGRLFYSTVSRLLVDLNRSPGHPRLYSAITRALSPRRRRALYERHYLPYRATLEEWIVATVRSGHRVIHVSVHSFTPVLDGLERRADVGLLYDPQRGREARLCHKWQQALCNRDRSLVVRRNYPYRGTSDGLTTHLRRRFRPGCYVGIELEINQKHTLGKAGAWRRLRRLLVASLQSALDAQTAPGSEKRRAAS